MTLQGGCGDVRGWNSNMERRVVEFSMGSSILSNNKIEELKNGSFTGLYALERLEIRNNIIRHIEPGTFEGLQALKRLDLSNNRIDCLNVDIFKGLASLVRLNLSGNLFSSLSPGTLDGLVFLKTLALQTQYLLCDCNLLWLLHWIKGRGIRVKDTRCSYPASLQGRPVSSLKPHLLTCDTPLELPSFRMIPSQRQVVFRGDSLPLRCLASHLGEDVQVRWYQDGQQVAHNTTEGLFIQHSALHNCSLFSSTLTIANVQQAAAGSWECRVQSDRRNGSLSVHILVLESSAHYCPPHTVSNNKGEFRWPRTLAGITAYLQCNLQATGAALSSGSRGEERRAWRRCERAGLWAQEDYSQCHYQNDITRVLHIINMMPLNLTNAVAMARQLLAYTTEAAIFSDKMDVVYVVQMVEKLGAFVERYRELGGVILELCSNLMLAEEEVLAMAEQEASACSRVVASLLRTGSSQLDGGTAGYSASSYNIALEAHALRARGFSGMTCTLFRKVPADLWVTRKPAARVPHAGQDRRLSFKCNVTSASPTLSLRNAVVEAWIQLPPSLLSERSGSGQSQDPLYRLLFLGFRNGKLFPRAETSSPLANQGKGRTVSAPVILVNIDGHALQSLHELVNVTLRRLPGDKDAVGGSWDSGSLGGRGRWVTDGCRVLSSKGDFMSLSCTALTGYALLTDVSEVKGSSSGTDLLHPVIYSSSIILLLCLLSLMFLYISHRKSIVISSKSRHMLVNLCLHVFLTCVAFVGGVAQTRHAHVCQAVGILLHHSSLATGLWMGVTARNIYKQVTRKAKRYEDPDEPPPPPRPMLRFYLIGGGIPAIVCGITAAANIKNYGSQINAPYCWMAREASLGSFFGPAAFIILVDCVYFLCVRVQLGRRPERRFELREPGEERRGLAAGEAGDSAPVSRGDASPSAWELENEQSFAAQLLGVSLALLLYCGLWVCGAMAVSRDGPLGLVFSCLFGLLALGLGAFMVTHHCFRRRDVLRHCPSACSYRGRSYSQRGNAHPNVNGEDPKLPKSRSSSIESSCTNQSPPCLRSSAHSCKLTNLQAEAAAQSNPNPSPASCSGQALGPDPAPSSIPSPTPSSGSSHHPAPDPLPDTGTTEPSLDSEINMHIAPLEVRRTQKGRVRAPRSCPLSLLREYAYDASTSVEGSERNDPPHLATRGRQTYHSQAQLASILGVLAKTAVAEITKLVDDGSAALRFEMCRSQRENEALKNKLMLMERELRAARGYGEGALDNSLNISFEVQVCDEFREPQRQNVNRLTTTKVTRGRFESSQTRDGDSVSMKTEDYRLQPTTIKREPVDGEQDWPESLLLGEDGLEEDPGRSQSQVEQKISGENACGTSGAAAAGADDGAGPLCGEEDMQPCPAGDPEKELQAELKQEPERRTLTPALPRMKVQCVWSEAGGSGTVQHGGRGGQRDEQMNLDFTAELHRASSGRKSLGNDDSLDAGYEDCEADSEAGSPVNSLSGGELHPFRTQCLGKNDSSDPGDEDFEVDSEAGSPVNNLLDGDLHPNRTLSPKTRHPGPVLRGQRRMRAGERASDHQRPTNFSQPVSRSSGRVYDKKHYCVYCQKGFLKISRHLETVHLSEPDVANAVRFPKNSKERHLRLSQLRNRGDYAHNSTVARTGAGEMVVCRRYGSKPDLRNLRYCLHCKGLYARLFLWKHMKTCKQKPKDGVDDDASKWVSLRGRVSMRSFWALSSPSPDISEELKKFLFSMADDDIFATVMDERCILQLGENMLSRLGKDGRTQDYIRQRLRTVAKLLIEVRKSTPLRNVEDLLIPSNFPYIVTAVKDLAGFDDVANLYRIPSLARRMAYGLHELCCMVEEDALAKGDSDLVQSTSDFKELLRDGWGDLIPAGPRVLLGEAKLDPPLQLRFTQDVKLLNSYLEKKLEDLQSLVRLDPTRLSYGVLTKVVLSQVVLFNRGRRAVLSAMPLTAFTSRDVTPGKPLSDDDSIPQLERKLCRHFARVELRGRGGEKVLVLLKPSLVAAMDLLLLNREACEVPRENRHMFARPGGLSYYEGGACIRQFAEECGAENTDAISSAKLRKHVATILNIISLKESGVLADLFGRDFEASGKHGLLMKAAAAATANDNLQLAELVKALLAMEEETPSEFSGVDDNKIDPREPTSEDDDAEESADEAAASEDPDYVDPPKTSPKRKIPHPKNEYGGPKRKWEKGEVEAVESQLMKFIRTRKVPGKRDCVRCLRAEPRVLKNRTWSALRFYVKNRIAASKKQK
ncbi:hypothetical protein SKAU_G00342840 [Synaphobranchus kaupii]|uniref:G-protein coupled receptor 125 n=1 Tax=Synaphobranchus kaupii TaxID=118154 RepID=A0A9Q1EIW9_SYNKA|nr:hypothetical protein SKAU_G00342840 [Synaphobranchus kaupii]